MFWRVMVRRWGENARFRIALLCSLALHCIAALLVPAITPAPAPSPDTLATISYQRIQRVALQSRAALPHAPAAVSAKRVVVVPHMVAHRAVAPVHKAAPTRPRAHAKVQPSPGAIKASQTFAVGPQRASPSPATPAPVALTKTAAPAVALPSSAPAALQQSRSVPNAEGAGTRSGVGLFGEVQDPALARPVMEQLLRRFRLNVTLVVTVSDIGRTMQIEFHPPVTPAVENQIRTLLAEANWDPALCGGGIACEGKATIKLSE